METENEKKKKEIFEKVKKAFVSIKNFTTEIN